MRTNGYKVVILALLALMLISTSVFAEGAKSIAVVIMAKGDVQVNQGDNWIKLAFGAVLNDGDKIRTGENGFAALAFTDDKSQIKLRPHSEVTLNADRNEDKSLAKRINMEVGELFADVKQQKGRMQVATPTSVASIKGTQFWIVVQPDGGTTLITLEGLLELLNQASGTVVEVGQGQYGTSSPDGEIVVLELQEGQSLPDWEEGEEGHRVIEIQFQDEDGTTKTMIIRFGQEEE